MIERKNTRSDTANAVGRAGIYGIFGPKGRVYIGQAINIRNRVARHKRELSIGTHSNIKLLSAWRKYGSDAFEFHVIEEIKDPEDLTLAEQTWMDLYDAFRRGYNIAPAAGSQLGLKHSAESRAKMRAAKTGKRLSEEHKEKLKGRVFSDEMRAKLLTANLGKTHTDETRKKISEAKLGRSFTDAHKSKISAAKLGWSPSDETRAKMSAAHLGAKRSDEARASMRAAQIRRYAKKRQNDGGQSITESEVLE